MACDKLSPLSVGVKKTDAGWCGVDFFFVKNAYNQ